MSGNLFSNLLSLHVSPVPGEDFFTELIAWFLDKNPDVLFAWLKKFLKLDGKYTGWSVETQVAYNKLEEHLTDSRPDIQISLFEGDKTDIVMVESKLGSLEGSDQLRRYAEQLAGRYRDARTRYLVYITRNHDPKDPEIITKNVDYQIPVAFRQLRWHEFYNFLQTQPPSPLLDEILEFMRKKHMAEITRLTPSTLSAFNSFPDVFKFFQTVLEGEVTDQFRNVLGQKPRFGLDQLQWRRQVLVASLSEWQFLLGFWMPEADEEFPYVGAQLQINAFINPGKWQNLANVFSQIEKDTQNGPFQWKGHGLDKFRTWADIDLRRSFSEILPEEDHVAALRRQLLIYLEETKRVFTNYPVFFAGSASVQEMDENYTTG